MERKHLRDAKAFGLGHDTDYRAFRKYVRGVRQHHKARGNG